MKNFDRMFFCLVVVCILHVFSLKSVAQAQEWLWVDSPDIKGYATDTKVATDINGNLYMTGLYAGVSATFGDIPLLITASSYSELFLVKYDAQGNVLWAKNSNSGSGESIYITDITTDTEGNSFITGYFFCTTLSFDSLTLNNSQNKTNPNGANSGDIFVVKFDTNGNVVWLRSGKHPYTEYGNALATDNSGNVYVAGAFIGSYIAFENDTLVNSSFNKGDIFIVKYDPEGNVLWARKYGGYDYESIDGFAVDSSGNIYVSGNFWGSFTTSGSTTLTSNGMGDFFIMKTDSTGNVLWAKSAGGSLKEYCTKLELGTDGNIYVVGDFTSPSVSFGAFELTKSDSTDMFIVKYDSTGNVLWAQSGGGIGEDLPQDMTISGNGNIYVTGYFTSPIAYFGETQISNLSSDDMFLITYDSEGTQLRAEVIGGNKSDRATGLASDNNGHVYISGEFRSSYLSFGETVIANDKVNFTDIIVARIGDDAFTTVQENIENSGISLFPNPAKSTFHISGIEDGNWNITIYSLTGEKIYESLLKDSRMIDLSGRAKGMYVYQLQKDGAVLKTGKLVVE